MGIKVVQIENVKSKPYPKLMISKGMGHVYLMISETTGTRIAYGKVRVPIGEYSVTYSSGDFVDYNEPLTLQNE